MRLKDLYTKHYNSTQPNLLLHLHISLNPSLLACISPVSTRAAGSDSDTDSDSNTDEHGPNTDRFPEEPEDAGAERGAHESLGGFGVVEETDLQRDESVLAQVQRLDQGVLRPVPKVDGLAVETCSRTKRDSSAIMVWEYKGNVSNNKKQKNNFIVQELCESRGGRPELSVLTSLPASVDVKIY